MAGEIRKKERFVSYYIDVKFLKIVRRRNWNKESEKERRKYLGKNINRVYWSKRRPAAIFSSPRRRRSEWKHYTHSIRPKYTLFTRRGSTMNAIFVQRYKPTATHVATDELMPERTSLPITDTLSRVQKNCTYFTFPLIKSYDHRSWRRVRIYNAGCSFMGNIT